MTHASPDNTPPSPKTIAAALLLILLIAFFFRFFGLQWGLPHHYHSDEDVMMYWAEAIRTRPIASLTNHPYFYVYSPLPLYWTALGGALQARIQGTDAPEPSRITFLYTWARSFSAVLGTLTCLLVFLTAASVKRPIIGLIAAFLLAVTPIHLRNSHFFTAEVPFTFFAALHLWSCVKVIRKPSRKWAIIGGLAAGGALLCKYTAAAYFPALLICMAIGLMQRERKNSPIKNTPSLIAYFLLPPILGLGLFFAADPWIFLNPENFLRTYRMLKEWSNGVRTPLWTAQFHDLKPGLYWFTSLLPTGYGIPLLLAAATGMLLSLKRELRHWSALWITGFLYFIMVGFSYMQYIRYTVPLAPAAALAAAVALGESYRRIERSRRIAPMFIWLCFFLAVTGVTAFRGAAYLHIYASPDTRDEASRWLHETYPDGTVLLTDNSAYRPPLGSERYQVRLDQNLVIRGGPYLEYKNYFTIRLLDCYNFLYRKDLSPEDRLKYLHARLEGADVVVFGEEAYEQFRHVRDQYPEVVDFFEQLFDGGFGFRFRKTFTRRPSLFGLTWSDADAELSWRLFDHPTIRVLSREVPAHEH